MQVRILYFAGLREQLDTSDESVLLPPDVKTAGELRRWLVGRGSPYAEALGAGKPVRMSVAQAMAGPETPLADGVEVAFFPPVTGG